MSHEGSAPSNNVKSCRPRSRPRSRQPAIHDPQPTSGELARLGVRVRDFVYDTTLPPVRPVYRQPRQIQPSIPRQLQREDTEPVDESQSQSMGSRQTLGRTLTEPVLEPVAGPSILRERGGFFLQCEPEINLDNSRPVPLNPEIGEHSIVPAGVAQGPGTDVHTPTVTPHGSLRWDFKEIRPNVFEGASLSRRTSSLHHISSGYSSPLTPLTPSPPQGSHLTSFNRSPSISSIHQQSPKRRKVVHENLDSRPVVNRYFLRKRTRTLVTGSSSSPSKRLHSAHTPATPLVRTASVRSDNSRRKRNVEAGPSVRPRGGGNVSGRQRRS
jgi:hypothetical protein